MSDPAQCLVCSTSTTFCVNIEAPYGFAYDQKGVTPFDICVRTSSNINCFSVPCTFQQNVEITDPCSGAPITCLGDVTVNKLVLSGDLSLLFNIPVSPSLTTDVGDCASVLPDGTILSNTPGTISVVASRQVTIPVCQTVCVSCSPVSCPVPGLSSVLSITIDSVIPSSSGCAGGFFNDTMSISGTINFNTC